jgi:hypothetical protein
MCFYLRELYAGSLPADDNEIRHARALNTYNNFHFKIISRISSMPRTFLYSLRSTLFLF